MLSVHLFDAELDCRPVCPCAHTDIFPLRVPELYEYLVSPCLMNLRNEGGRENTEEHTYKEPED
jgi:hypothetical protein